MHMKAAAVLDPLQINKELFSFLITARWSEHGHYWLMKLGRGLAATQGARQHSYPNPPPLLRNALLRAGKITPLPSKGAL